MSRKIFLYFNYNPCSYVYLIKRRQLSIFFYQFCEINKYKKLYFSIFKILKIVTIFFFYQIDKSKDVYYEQKYKKISYVPLVKNFHTKVKTNADSNKFLFLRLDTNLFRILMTQRRWWVKFFLCRNLSSPMQMTKIVQIMYTRLNKFYELHHVMTEKIKKVVNVLMIFLRSIFTFIFHTTTHYTLHKNAGTHLRKAMNASCILSCSVYLRKAMNTIMFFGIYYLG